jgi:hypothetical protein
MAKSAAPSSRAAELADSEKNFDDAESGIDKRAERTGKSQKQVRGQGTEGKGTYPTEVSDDKDAFAAPKEQNLSVRGARVAGNLMSVKGAGAEDVAAHAASVARKAAGGDSDF